MTQYYLRIGFLLPLLFISSCALMSEHEFTKLYAAPYAPYDNALLKLDKHIKSNHLGREEASAAWFGALYNRKHSAEPKTIKYLIDNVGVNITIPYLGYTTAAVSGMTPLMLACTNENNSAEIFEMLIIAGADINAKFYYQDNISAYQYKSTMNGSTPLHFCSGEVLAIKYDDISNNKGWNKAGTRALLQHGADPLVKNNQGRTPSDSNFMAEVTAEKRWAKKREESRNSFDMGKAMAIAGGVAIAGSSNLSSSQKAEFMANYTTDVLGNTGGTNTKNWGNQSSQKNTYSQTGVMSKRLNDSSQSVGGAFSCNNVRDHSCGSYIFDRKTEYDNAVKQCEQLGLQKTKSCSPGPSCTSKRSGNTYRTYYYDLPSGNVKTNCMNAGAVFKP